MKDGTIVLEPEKLLDRKLIPRTQGDIQIPVARWLIKWANLEEQDATWEDATFIQKVFPAFRPEDRLGVDRGELSGPN